MTASRTSDGGRAARLRGGRAAAPVVVALLFTGLVGGCGTAGVREDDARAAATGFERALDGKDFAGVCARLAPQTREELENSEGKRCADAVGGLSLPAAGDLVRVRVYGRQAQA